MIHHKPRPITIAALLAAGFLVAALLSGCASAKPAAFKTLYAVGRTTDTAVKTYFDLVVTGQVRTNGVPRVTRAYEGFQTGYRTALAIAQFNPNAPADSNLVARSVAVIGLVTAEKEAQ